MKRPRLSFRSLASVSVLALLTAAGTFLIVLEIYLRCASPLALRVRGDRLSVPKNVVYVIHNKRIPQLDEEIIHRRNSLGFRGSEPPLQFRRALSVVTVGGSTTECFYLNDGQTWTDQLAARLARIKPNSWVNNAGFDGHSTFGHLILVRDYLSALRPDFVIFLIGLNDVERDDLNAFDFRGSAEPRRRLLMDRVYEKSYALSFLRNLRRSLRAYQKRLTHEAVNFRSLPQRPPIPNAERQRLLRTQTSRYLPGYRARLERLISMTREHDMRPILVTQPALYGPATDPSTGINLAAIQISETRNGALAWDILEMYNDVTRSVARDLGVPLVDLAREMPKSTSFYYDLHHFTPKGAERVADILFRKIEPLLRNR